MCARVKNVFDGLEDGGRAEAPKATNQPQLRMMCVNSGVEGSTWISERWAAARCWVERACRMVGMGSMERMLPAQQGRVGLLSSVRLEQQKPMAGLGWSCGVE